MLDTQYGADLLVTDGSGRPVVAVELKNSLGLTRDVAVQLRRNLLDHQALGDGRYFLLLSQDWGYLWNEAQTADCLAPPAQEFPMQAVVARYAGHLGPSERLHKAELAAVIFRWLLTVAHSPNGLADEAERALRDAGLVDAISGGAVRHQMAE